MSIGTPISFEEKREQLARLLKSQPRWPKYSVPSFAQQRMWFLSQFQPTEPLYHMPIPLRLTGALNERALRDCLSEIYRRHDALRTSFPARDGKPVQRIDGPRRLRLPTVDLSGLTESQAEAVAKRIVHYEQHRLFDLSRSPLLRLRLLRIRPQEHVLVITMHHIITDGWSMGVLLREMNVLYEAFRQGRPSPLPDLRIQYADFAVWQRGHLQGETLEEHLRYWKNELTGLATIELPTDFARPTAASHTGTSLPFTIPLKLANDLLAFTQREAVTPFMLTLAVWALLLGRYAGQRDICVGVPIANRNREEIEALIGFFVNTLVMRVDLTGNPTFRELLARVRERVIGAYAHQDLPIERLVDELDIAREMSRPPLFQVMLVVQNTPSEDDPRLGDVEIRGMGSDRPVSDFEMTLAVNGLGDQGLGCILEYVTDLFTERRIKRLIGHLQVLFQEIVTDAGRPIEELEWLTEAERRRLLSEWKRKGVLTEPRLCAHELFQRQAERAPERIAVIDGGQQISYRELNRRANQCAHALRAKGVGPEQAVGLLLDRGADLVIATLAVLKAGGAYVPLDPDYPTERIAYMLRDSQARLVLTQPQFEERIPVGLDILYADHRQMAGESDANPVVHVALDNLAHVIYTSGSTGEPKGVAVTHGGMSHLVGAMRERICRIDAGGVMLQFASWSFDAATWEWAGALLQGGRLALGRREEMLPGMGLERILREHQVDVAALPPSVLGILEPEGLGGLGTLVAAVEACAPELVGRWSRGREFFNGYGQTETTVAAVMYGPMQCGQTPRIGQPLAGVEVFVLDGDMRPVPVGVPGELMVGGEGLTRGYVRQPALTAEKFVPHPYSEQPGARLYRTGDRAQWTENGELEFVGRVDAQVKLRGYRIDLGEIETILGRQEGVRQAVVTLREDEPGRKQLAAYVIGEPAQPLDGEQLRASLQARLPEFMVPAAVICLERFPLTSNGKVDKRALPGLRATRESTHPGTGARTPVEEILAGIWMQVLKLDRVDAQDDFFALGGHSLLATQVVSRIRSLLHIDLPLRSLFEKQVFGEFAQHVQTLLFLHARQAEPKMARRRRNDAPLSFAQQRLWFDQELKPGWITYNMASALRLSGELNEGALRDSLSEIVRRHEVLRTAFPVVDGKPVQRIAAAQPVPLPVVDLSGMPAGRREALAQALAHSEAARPFDLARGPLLRWLLLRLEAGEQVLLSNLHHIVSDGWSLGVFTRELSSLYEAYRQGERSPLAELPIQYADYAVWQREWMQAEALSEQLEYWREQLRDLSRLELPVDYARPKVARWEGASVAFRLPEELTEALKRLSRQEGATLFMTLLAGFQVLLSRWAGQEDVTVGTPIANRNRAEIEGLIGFFVNTLVLRGAVTGAKSFRQLLKEARETTLGAYAHQDLPFEKLVEELAPERDLSRTPLFQVMLVLQNVPESELQLGDLRIRSLDVDSPDVMHELALILGERGDGTIEGLFAFPAALFARETIGRAAERWTRLIAAAVADPDSRIDALTLMSGSERRQVLVDWNATKLAVPEPWFVPSRFDQIASAMPDAIALAAEGAQVSYGELRARSNQLANYLRRRQVRGEVRVAVLLERSPELVMALLAVWKAGGAYVPLDLAYPADRLNYMVADAKAAIVLTNSALVSLVSGNGAAIVALDEHAAEIQQESCDSPSLISNPENLAYVIYTSGSTGKPKGAAVPHRGLASLAAHQIGILGLRPGDAFLQLLSFGFDVATHEWMVTLLSGGKLLLTPAEHTRGGPGLVEFFRVQQAAASSIPTALLSVLPGEDIPTLQTIITGGEALPPATSARWSARRRLLNAYGPTEATICTTLGGPFQPDEAPHIGRPIANVRVYVLDGSMEPTPAGVPGELFIGGIGVARGYIREPALTAERFTPDPFAPQPGARLYRTGDRVRWTLDGRLEFLGRLDAQVKIRGFRVELGEIQSVIEGLPGVRQAAVVLKESARGKRIAAYVTPDSSGGAPHALREGWLKELRAKLPEHMLPGSIVTLPGLPLKPNGKLNEAALPEPDWRQAEDYQAAATPVQEILMELWSETLGVERVGARDNFFALGGHSLLAAQVISRVRGALGVETPLRTLFTFPVLAEFARQVEADLRGENAPAAPPILPVPRTGPLPVSFAQQRLWFVQQLEPRSTAYHVPMAFELSGELDMRALEESLNQIVRRHEVLRTTFPLKGDDPVQQIGPAVDVRLLLVDLSGTPARLRQAAAEQVVAHFTAQPFDLGSGPLFQAALARLAAERHVLVISTHHIVIDGWSVGVFWRELASLYESRRAGRPSDLPELTVQYADYAAWQRAWLRGEALENELSFWRERLAGWRPLDLPTDYPRKPTPSHRGSVVSFMFPQELSDKLRSFGAARGATLFMTLLAGFQALLARYAGQDDIVVGADVANRDRIEIESLIGFFINQLVLRSRIGTTQSFAELLEQVRAATLDAYAHAELPFEKLVEELAPARDLSRAPIFQVKLVMQNAPRREARLGDLEIASFGGIEQSIKTDINLMVQNQAAGIEAGLIYATDLFERATMERMAAHWKTLLSGAVEDPGRPVADLPLMTAAERRQLVSRSTVAGIVRAPGLTAHVAIARQAARAPDSIAAVSGCAALSRGELERRANQLAHYLRALGVGPEIRVGLCLDPGLEMVIGLVGILRSGGAYVGLEPGYPAERLAQMIEDAQVSLLLTTANLRDRLPSMWAQIVDLDKDWEQIGAYGAGSSGEIAAPENLAYVLYTSGSIGRPKAVGIERRNLDHYIAAVSDRLELGPANYALVSTLAADLGNTALYPALCSGGALHLIDRDMARDPRGLAAYFVQRAIDIVKIVPSHLHGLMQAAPDTAAALMTRKKLILGGEASAGAWVNQIRGLAPHCAIANHYGPTECTVGVATHAAQDVSRRASLPIGNPLAGNQLYVLDGAQAELPAGVPGELYVGGPQVARGYLNDPALTAERFSPDPFTSESGGRLYRTGDRARRLADGELEFLGRVDNQIKLRGHRIELGDVESSIARLPGVTQCAVAVRESPSGERRLVAYVAPASVQGLRAALLQQLPEHMIPAEFVTLESLPVTPNGKLDRNVLAAIDRPGGQAAGRLGPRDNTETHLQQIWEEVLGVEAGLRDDFFALGGHSMSAVSLCARLEAAYGRAVTIRTVFERPTIETMAAYLRQEIALAPPSSILPLRAQGSRPPLFCVHASGGMVSSYLELARELGPEQPVFGFQCAGLHRAEEPLHSIPEMAAAYISDLKAFQPDGPYQLAGWSMGGVLAFEMARQLSRSGNRVALLALLDSFFGSGPVDAGMSEQEIERRASEGLIINAARTLGSDPEQMRALSFEDQMETYLRRAQDAGIFPRDWTLAQFRRWVRVTSINSLASMQYRPAAYDGAALLLNTAAGDPEAEPGRVLDDHRGLAGVALGGLTIHRIEGRHSDLMEKPAVGAVAAILTSYLNPA